MDVKLYIAPQSVNYAWVVCVLGDVYGKQTLKCSCLLRYRPANTLTGFLEVQSLPHMPSRRPYHNALIQSAVPSLWQAGECGEGDSQLIYLRIVLWCNGKGGAPFDDGLSGQEVAWQTLGSTADLHSYNLIIAVVVH